MEADGVRTLEGVHVVPKVNVTICTGCGQCVAACPHKIITLETIRFHKNAVITHPELCNACGWCIKACPVTALLWEP
jgi:ferredoxin